MREGGLTLQKAPARCVDPTYCYYRIERATQHARHLVVERDGGTRMVDTFAFASPFGPVGGLVNALVLTRYMRAFLRERNTYLKRVAEAGHA
jgi:ligand-binding SRPBCC domain-containing protein